MALSAHHRTRGRSVSRKPPRPSWERSQILRSRHAVNLAQLALGIAVALHLDELCGSNLRLNSIRKELRYKHAKNPLVAGVRLANHDVQQAGLTRCELLADIVPIHRLSEH